MRIFLFYSRQSYLSRSSSSLKEAACHDFNILAYQIRSSAIFTSADKSYLTYNTIVQHVDKNRISTRVVNIVVVQEVT